MTPKLTERQFREYLIPRKPRQGGWGVCPMGHFADEILREKIRDLGARLPGEDAYFNVRNMIVEQAAHRLGVTRDQVFQFGCEYDRVRVRDSVALERACEVGRMLGFFKEEL